MAINSLRHSATAYNGQASPPITLSGIGFPMEFAPKRDCRLEMEETIDVIVARVDHKVVAIWKNGQWRSVDG